MNDLRTRARWLATAVLLVLIVMLVLFSLQILGADRLGKADSYWWASMLPMPLYVYAIGAVWRTLLGIAAGQRNRIIGRMLGRVGIALFIGSLLELFGVALLSRLLGAGGPPFTYDLAPITLGVLGAVLHFVARLMDEAEAAKAELEEFV